MEKKENKKKKSETSLTDYKYLLARFDESSNNSQYQPEIKDVIASVKGQESHFCYTWFKLYYCPFLF